MARVTAMEAVVAVAVMAIMLLPPGRAGARSTEEHPHGLPYESPLALSPAAYEFFHPSARRERTRQAYGAAQAPAPAPRRQQQLRESVVKGGTSSASVARADQEEETAVGTVRSGAFRAGKVAGVLAGAIAVALVAIGVAYAVARRRLARGGGTEAAGAPKSSA